MMIDASEVIDYSETTEEPTGLESHHQEEEEEEDESSSQNETDEDNMAASLPTASSWWLSIEERRKSRNTPSRNKWVALLFGQLIALVSSSMNAASFTLAYHNHVDTQLFQLFL
eukprot:scaffold36744_cov206-Amphora_coffeaeformis.AAC.1